MNDASALIALPSRTFKQNNGVRRGTMNTGWIQDNPGIFVRNIRGRWPQLATIRAGVL
jgi:hypothetical protein